MRVAVLWRARSRLPYAGIALLVAVFLRDALFQGRIFYERDLHLQWYAQAERFVRCLAEGSWPLWDPYVSFGQPLLANPNNQLLYPPSWLHLVLRPGTYYTLFLGAHLAFAGWGLVRLARRLGLSDAAAFAAGALWVASGPLLSLGNLWNHLAAAAWMPWIVLAAEAALASASARAIVALALAIALQIVTGSPDVTAMTGLLVAAFAARSWDWRRPAAAANLRLLGAGTAALLLALAVSAGQWLPSLELASASSRRDLGAIEAQSWSVHPAGLVQAFVPILGGDLALDASWRAALFDGREPYLTSLYVGIPTLLLAGVGLWRRRDGLALTLLGVGLVAALFALGRHAPLFPLLFDAVPAVRMLRFPVKGLVLAGFCASLLAGFGIDAWREPGPLRAFRATAAMLLAAGLAFALAAAVLRFDADRWARLLLEPEVGVSAVEGLGVASARLAWAAGLAFACWALLVLRARGGSDRRHASALAAGLLGVADLIATHHDLQRTAPRQLVSFVPDAARSIEQRDYGRLFVYDYLAVPGLSARHLGRDAPYVVLVPRGDPSRAWLEAFAARSYLLPPTAAVHGLFGSFERDLLRIQPRPLVGLNALLAFTDGSALQGRLLRLAAVRQMVALHDPGLPGVSASRSFDAPFLEPIRLFEVADARPRTYVVGGVRVADGRAGLDALLAPDLDIAREVVLPSGTPRPPPPGFRGSSEIVEMKADRVRLRCEANLPGHVVLVDTWDAGWQVRLDGRPVPLLRANVAFRAVAVPAGRHEVEMVYRPASVGLGAALSCLGLVACGGLVRAGRAARTG